MPVVLCFSGAKRHVGSDQGAPNALDAGGRTLGGLTAPTTAVEVVHALRNEIGDETNKGSSGQENLDLEAAMPEPNHLVYR